MKKLESSITNMVIVLVGVALITGAILAYVNHITTGPIKEQAEKTLTDGIKKVMGGGEITVTGSDTYSQTVDGKELTYVIHKVNDAQGKDLGAAVESTTVGFGGDLTPMATFLATQFCRLPRLLDSVQRLRRGFRKMAKEASSA